MQYQTALDGCCLCLFRVLLSADMDMYLSIGALYSDMMAHEKALDGLIELLSKDQVRK